MRNREIQGWPLPQETAVSEYDCYIVRVPSKPEYRTAFYSAWDKLRNWLSWEKRGDRSAAEAAELFSRYLPIPVDCEVVESLDEDGNMAINVTVTQNCGCGCGGGSDMFEQPDNYIDDGTGKTFPDEPSTEETAVSSQDLCNMANYLGDLWVATYADLEDAWAGISITVTSVQQWLVEKFPAGALIPFIAWILSSLATALEAAYLANVLGRCEDAAVTYRDELVCAISSATSAAEAKRSWLSVLKNVENVYGKFPYVIQYLTSQALNFDGMFAGEINVPSSYNGSVCDCLRVVGYEYEPIVIEDLVTVAGTGITGVETAVSQNGINVVAIADGGDEGAHAIFNVRRPRVGGPRLVGIVYKFESIENVKNNHFGARTSPDKSVWGASSTSETGLGVHHVINMPGNGDYVAPEGDILMATTNIKVNSCYQNYLEVGIGGESLVGGRMEWSLGNLYWVRKVGLGCP